MNAAHVPGAPVAIVGGGPVGLMLALLLDRHGVASVVFDSASGTRLHPKGSTHNTRTMEHYRRVGIADAVRKLGLPADHPRDVAYFTRLLDGFELARFALPSEQQRMRMAQDAPADDQAPEPLLRANQMYVDRHMLEHARGRPNISLRFGWRVTGFEQDDSGVWVTAVDSGGSGATERWRAQYMAGCDGGHSFVRRELGIGYLGAKDQGAGFLTGRMFSTHVRIPALQRDIPADQRAWMYNMMSPGLRMLLISLNGADEFLLMSKAKSDDEQPDDLDIVKRIRQGIGAEVEVEVLAHAVWHGGTALVAERFSERRIHLAGDAIHLFSPTGGFGMNTGIDGAANLAWKLAAAVQGWAGESLLDSYETERRPIAHRNTAAARQLTERVATLAIPDEIEAAGQHGEQARAQLGAVLQEFRGQFTSLGVELGARYDGSPIVWPDGEPPADDPLDYHPSDVPGGRLPHLWLDGEGAQRRSLFDLLHHGFTLLRIGADPAPAERLAAAADTRGIPLRVLDIASDAASKLYRKRLILVRPDQHIAWRGDQIPADAHAVLDRAVGRGVGAQARTGRPDVIQLM
ncbi:FAD-dependent monooxygenase [Massilia antarctica]|nr:FAD-dependent monooxygenase [Massilia antarctica]